MSETKAVAKMEIINPDEFGVQEQTAKKIDDAFLPKVTERNLTVSIYEQIIGKEITDETAKEARELRLSLVKIRTGINAVHKAEKAMALAYGKFCDARKNKEVLPCEQMEEKLLEIEKFQEKIEADNLKKLTEERTKELEVYKVENIELMNVGAMPEEVWKNFFEGIKYGQEKKIEEEKKAKAEEEAKAKKEAEEKKLAEEKLQKQQEERNLELRPYIIYIRDYTKMLALSEEDYKKELAEIKQAAAEQIEHEKKEEEAEARRVELKRLADEKKAKEEKAAALKLAEEEKQKALAEERRKTLEAENKRKEEEKKKADELEAEKEREEQAKIEAELSKGDSEKVKDLKEDLNALKTKYSFDSKANIKMYSDVNELIDKVVKFIK